MSRGTWTPLKIVFDVRAVGFFVFTGFRFWPGTGELNIREAHKAVMWAKRFSLEFRLEPVTRGNVEEEWLKGKRGSLS